MKKVGWIIIGIIVLLAILLIWGFIGKYYTDTSSANCDIGIKQKIIYDKDLYDPLGMFQLKEYKTYLCWIWHKEPELTQEEQNEIVKNQTDQLFGPK